MLEDGDEGRGERRGGAGEVGFVGVDGGGAGFQEEEREGGGVGHCDCEVREREWMKEGRVYGDEGAV